MFEISGLVDGEPYVEEHTINIEPVSLTALKLVDCHVSKNKRSQFVSKLSHSNSFTTSASGLDQRIIPSFASTPT